MSLLLYLQANYTTTYSSYPFTIVLYYHLD